MGILDGKIALVTGGGRGIGRGISEALGREGATVLINYRRDKEAAEETANAIVAAGGKASIHQASTDVPDDCRRMMDEIHAQYGGLDIAIVNGGNASRGRSIVDTDEKELWNLVETHALGPHQLCRAFIPEMRKKGGGHVVFISSVATKGLSANGAPYNMGKAAMEALALTLAKEELPNRIHVNIVAPGLVETDMGVRLARAIQGKSKEDMADLRAMDASSPFGRVCQPEDIAGAVLFLLSPWSGYVTGQRIEVDGGSSGIRR
ncbi:MAG: SDR family oxidoreductase [Actinobacteria bacterium]|nr:SDR family oxidoreductase [Actinomycetota bacterium]